MLVNSKYSNANNNLLDNDPDRTLYFSSPLYRKNLHYSILPKAEGQKEAIKEMAKYILEKHPQDTGIIYCRRKKVSRG
jgi:ATP-dependent DNA helicase Q1